jgi:hypothetical protein
MKKRKKTMIALSENQIHADLKKETSKLELYRLLVEGYKAVEDGRTSSIEDVMERFEERRKRYCVYNSSTL